MNKNLNFIQALFLVGLYLKLSAAGYGAQMTWLEVAAPLLFWLLWTVGDLALRIFGVTDRIEAWWLHKLTRVVSWKKKRELINQFKPKK